MMYEPAEDSLLLAESVKKAAKGKHVLDMCTGSGLQALTAKKSGALTVLAVDIQPDCVLHVKKLGIDALQSDLFTDIKGNFDLIICNPPYLPHDDREDAESAVITTGGKKGDEFLIRFLKEAPKYLAPKGEILLVLSSLTPKAKIGRILDKIKLKKTIVSKKKLFMEELEVWKLVSSVKDYVWSSSAIYK